MKDEAGNSGIIVPDSAFGNKIGFTSAKFSGYLWWEGDRILISLIETRRQGRGDLSRLMDAIEGAGYRIAVPTPSDRMRDILAYKGFTPHTEASEIGATDMWEKEVKE